VSEINPELSLDLQDKLDEIIPDKKSVFPKTNLDVGKFNGFTVQLNVDASIPPEKQRCGRRLIAIFFFGTT
jgi:hypothetical protein